jgi:hypothetical protein
MAYHDTLESMLVDLEQRQFLEEITDVEGMTSLTQFVGFIASAYKQTMAWFKNYHETADIVSPESIAPYMKAINKKGWTALAESNVYLPPYCKTNFLTYAKEISRQAQMMSDIEHRLYKPVLQRMQKAEALDNLHNTPWADKNLHMLDVRRLKSDIRKVNAEDDAPEDLKVLSETVATNKAFRSLRELEVVQHLVEDMDRAIKGINLEHLRKIEGEILVISGKLLDDIEEGKKEPLTKAAQKQFVEAFRALAEETEYLTAIVFAANTTIEAWNKTIVKLNEAASE